MAIGIATATFVALPARADYWTTVYTPYGSPVDATKMTYEMSSAEVAYTNRYLVRTYPRARMLRSSSRRYNCHSYAWYSSSSLNSIWINDPGDDTYWEDGSYYQVSASAAPSSARVSYYYDDHSAIRITASDFVSKWGQGPLMRHAPGYAPYDDYYLVYFVRSW